MHQFEPLTRWQAIIKNTPFTDNHKPVPQLIIGTPAEIEKAKLEHEIKMQTKELEAALHAAQPLIMSHQTYEMLIGACWRSIKDCLPPIGASVEIRLREETEKILAAVVLMRGEWIWFRTRVEERGWTSYFTVNDVEFWKHAK